MAARDRIEATLATACAMPICLTLVDQPSMRRTLVALAGLVLAGGLAADILYRAAHRAPEARVEGPGCDSSMLAGGMVLSQGARPRSLDGPTHHGDHSA